MPAVFIDLGSVLCVYRADISPNRTSEGLDMDSVLSGRGGSLLYWEIEECLQICM